MAKRTPAPAPAPELATPAPAPVATAAPLADRVASFVTLMHETIAHRADGQRIKGASLAAAHALYDGADKAALLTIADLLPATKKGGDKAHNAAAKLANRYQQVAVFLVDHGLSFATVGEQLSEKQVITINLVERVKKASKDQEDPHHAAGLTWQADKSFIAYLANCEALDAEAKAAEFQRLEQASAARFKMEMDKQAEQIKALQAQLKAAKAGAAGKASGKRQGQRQAA